MDAGVTWAAAMAYTHEVAFSPREAAERHFTTSIDVGDHVAREVLRRYEAAAARHDIQDPWIVDVGAGSGRLLQQLLDLGVPGDRLLGVDVRPAPDLPVHWIQGRAPDCLPPFEGLVIAHEFLDDIPADVVCDDHLVTIDGSQGPPASPDDVAWAARWGDGTTGRTRDEAWARIVGSVIVGEAIAVDYPRCAPVGHRHGRRGPATPDGHHDISAGVEFRSLRAVSGGRIVPQHRVLPATNDPELAVLRDRSGLGVFLWLFTDVPRRDL